ncbi:thioesterase II family protein [Teredinibacter purpureus]|uniref:thioesterase II family protein n=1 Tax=Teredinibacter purpureus TaxID=2731756 RepID=UPI0005F7B2AE|nr:thioesterase domain-containing protein [Teredinibacter purpureus]
MNRTSLIYTPKPLANARFRLLCFSYAGGNSATFLPWATLLPSTIELSVVQLPGRGVRYGEPCYNDLQSLTLDLFNAYKKLPHKDTIFFGHSMGARVAFELLIMLRRFQSSLPLHFIASASAAPTIPRETIFHTLSDEDFIRQLGNISGAPKAALANPEIAELALPSLRADFKIIETSPSGYRGQMPMRLSILAGFDDRIRTEDLLAWQALFRSTTDINWINGGHFFVDAQRDETISVLLDTLTPTLETVAAAL